MLTNYRLSLCMENITITYNDRKLVVLGAFQSEEPTVGLPDQFFSEEITHNDIDVYDDYESDEIDEIETLCIKEVKGIHQSNLEDLIN